MIKREIKRYKRKIERFMDPLAILAFIAILILPTFAVLNLSPSAKSTKVVRSNVLGESDSKTLSFALVGGIHSHIRNEKLNILNTDEALFSSKILKHSEGRYSKPILQLSNNGWEDREILVTANSRLSTTDEISIIIEGTEYILQSQANEPFTVGVRIPARAKTDMYLMITGLRPVSYSNDIEIKVVVK